MNKKIGIMVVLIIILASVSAIILKNGAETSSETKNNPEFLLDGFPIDKIPLYKQNKISSSKVFVNTDPRNTSIFGENNFAYYNIVFESDASQEELLNYYKGIFDSQIKEEFENPEMVKGKIGNYKVSVAHYNDGTGYLQAYLSDYKDESINKYLVNFPEILKENSNIVEQEKSFGLLNQKNGEIEFTKYFTVVDSGDQNKDGKDDVDEFLLLETEYEGLYGQKPEYSYDQKTEMMKWKEEEFEVTLTFSRNHGRIYLMIRKPYII